VFQCPVCVARARDGEALDCAAIVRNPEYGEVKRMFVVPQARSVGIGRALLRFLETEACTRGCRKPMLETGDRHHTARAYRAHGFRERGPFRAYRPDPRSVFMERELAK